MVAVASGGDGGADLALNDRAYREIKRRMRMLDLRPNEWYQVGQIAEQLGIGRTPVRDALKLLASEGLVRIETRLGVLIPALSMRSFEMQVEARLVIEPAIVALAASRATEAELDGLRGLLDRVPAHISPLQIEKLMDMDGEFHARIAEMSRNRDLGAALNGLIQGFLRFWSLALIEVEHSARVADEHWVIYGALRSRNARRAAQAARDHIETFRSRFLRFFADAMRDPEKREMFDANDR